MGWTSFHLYQPVKEWFLEEHKSDKLTVLDIAVVRLNTLYAAIKDNSTNQVYCLIYLLHWNNKSYENFMYKDMTEFVGPFECACPLRIFNKLTPLDENDPTNIHAIEWRKRVIKYHETKNLNCIIKTNDSISFNNGMSFNYFKKERGITWAGEFIDNDFKYKCRVRGIKFEFVKHELIFI